MDGKVGSEGQGLAPSPYMARDPEALARNLARAVEEGGRALAAYLKPREKGQLGEPVAEMSADILKTLVRVGEYWTADPTRLVEAQTRLFSDYVAIWQDALTKVAGDGDGSVVEPKPGDKRFADPDWEANPVFKGLKEFYLATARWAEDMVNEAELDERTKQKARFYVQQINNALAPTNFPMTNPEVLKLTAETNAENLVKGMRMLAEDIEAGNGKLRLRQTDPKSFKLGETIATTPGKVIYQNDIFQLIQYAQATDTVLKRPLLIVPPWINKFYILDLNREKSFIRWAVAQGLTVFCVSWVNPDERHADKGFAEYMREGIFAALLAVR